jgi:hypothetical protein
LIVKEFTFMFVVAAKKFAIVSTVKVTMYWQIQAGMKDWVAPPRKPGRGAHKSTV